MSAAKSTPSAKKGNGVSKPAPKRKPAAKKKAAPKGTGKKTPSAGASTGKVGPKKAAPKKSTPKQAAQAGGNDAGGKRKRPVWRRACWWGFKFGSAAGLLFLLLSSALVVTFRYVNPPLTPLMILRNVQEEEDVRKRWRDYDEISPEFLLSVVAAEDQLFFKHNGFDLKQIKAAIETRLDGGRLRGGSTISQQVAKNVFLWPGRSWLRKGLEAWFTVGIELCWSKERILEVYVNIAEMGEGIYGVEAAAQHYYGKPSSALTREESALLAAILPAPRSRSPLEPTPYLRERQAWILGQMRNLGGTSYLKSEV